METESATQLIDCQGFRHNVGIIITNGRGELFWARRVGRDIWQFPQGGIHSGESPEEAMYRELYEEIGLLPAHVAVVASTPRWLKYRLPKALIRHDRKPLCIGQKQIWFMLRMVGTDEDVRLDASNEPEFDHWRWVNYWHPLREVVSFKRAVYEKALDEFAPLINERSQCGSRCF